MKLKKQTLYVIFLSILILLGISGCSSRFETPILDADGTLVYPAKNGNDIKAKIILCRKEDPETGNRIGTGTIFTNWEEGNIRAFFDLENRFAYGERMVVFHINWIGTDGSSLYQKEIDLSPNESTNTINSSISIDPETREPGAYTVQIFLYRELIAEKKFEIRPVSQVTASWYGKIKPNIRLYRKESKKTGKLIGEGTSFTIDDKERVRTMIDFETAVVDAEQELVFYLDWIGPEGESVYRKENVLYPGESISTLESSISIAPDKRAPGEYTLRLSLFDEIIAEQAFEIKP